MRNLLLSIAILTGLSFDAFEAQAQRATVYPITFLATNTPAPGTTNAVMATSTNTFLNSSNTIFITCSEFDWVGLDLRCAGTSSSTGNLIFPVARSFNNGATFETSPTNNFIVTLNGTTAVEQLFVIDAHCATHLAITSCLNSNAVGGTNFSGYWVLKSPKFGAKAATQ